MSIRVYGAVVLAALASRQVAAFPMFYDSIHAGCMIPDMGFKGHGAPAANPDVTIMVMSGTTAVTEFTPGEAYTIESPAYAGTTNIWVHASDGIISTGQATACENAGFSSTPAADHAYEWTAPATADCVTISVAQATGASDPYNTATTEVCGAATAAVAPVTATATAAVAPTAVVADPIVLPVAVPVVVIAEPTAAPVAAIAEPTAAPIAAVGTTSTAPIADVGLAGDVPMVAGGAAAAAVAPTDRDIAIAPMTAAEAPVAIFDAPDATIPATDDPAATEAASPAADGDVATGGTATVATGAFAVGAAAVVALLL